MDFEAFERDGLIFTTDLSRVGFGPRPIAKSIQRGQLLHLRRGAYVRPEAWAALTPAGQHLLRVRAAATAARGDVVLARESAAAAWRIPLDEFPADVVILDRWRGGGRSEPGVVRTSRGATTARVVRRNGFRCTTLARTALDVVRLMPFPQAVKYLDWCLSAKNPLATSREELVAEASTMKVSSAVWRAIDFATDVSGSIGESEARAVIHLLGYPRPELQRKYSDAEGDMFPDFYFPGADAAVEFDGKEKYTRNEYTKGDPAEVVWREKKREDRLRRQVRTVVRVLTSDVHNPAQLDRKLRDAGIHRTVGGTYGQLAGVPTPATRKRLPPPRTKLPPPGTNPLTFQSA